MSFICYIVYITVYFNYTDYIENKNSFIYMVQQHFTFSFSSSILVEFIESGWINSVTNHGFGLLRQKNASEEMKWCISEVAFNQ